MLHRTANMKLQTSKIVQTHFKNATFLISYTNEHGRHANLCCHGGEGVPFRGRLSTRKLLQHHGNCPLAPPLQQADRQVHSASHRTCVSIETRKFSFRSADTGVHRYESDAMFTDEGQSSSSDSFIYSRCSCQRRLHHLQT